MKSQSQKIRILALVLAGGSIGAIAESGNGVGNGGDAVVCRFKDGRINTAQLLDFWEYFDFLQRDLDAQFNELRGQKLDLIAAGRDKKLFKLSPESFLRVKQILTAVVLPKLSLRHPQQVKRIAENLEAFLEEASFVPNIELTDISDSDHIAFPVGCKAEQFINQTPNSKLLPGRPRYVFNKDIWDEMSALHQIGSISHELIYREEVEAGAKNSIFTRYLNAQLYSANFRSFEGAPSELFSVSMSKGFAEFKYYGGYFKIDLEKSFHKTKVPLRLISIIEPELKIGNWRSKIRSDSRSAISTLSGIYENDFDEWGLYPDGKIQSLRTQVPTLVRFDSKGNWVRAHGVVRFDETGDLIEAGMIEASKERPIQIDEFTSYGASNFSRRGSFSAGDPIWLATEHTVRVGSEEVTLPVDTVVVKRFLPNQQSALLALSVNRPVKIQLPKFFGDVKTVAGVDSIIEIGVDAKITGFKGRVSAKDGEIYIVDQEGLRVNVDASQEISISTDLAWVHLFIAKKQPRESRKKYLPGFTRIDLREFRDP